MEREGWDARAAADTGVSRLIPRRSVSLFRESAGLGSCDRLTLIASAAPVCGVNSENGVVCCFLVSCFRECCLIQVVMVTEDEKTTAKSSAV